MNITCSNCSFILASAIFFKFVGDSSLFNSYNGDGWGMGLVVGGDGAGGSIAENFGAVLLSMSLWFLLVSGDKN